MIVATTQFVSAAEAIEELAAGRFLVVADSESPESDADVMIAAEFASAEAINFLATEARGVVYLGLSDERCREMELGPMTAQADPRDWKSAFTVMIDAREGISTGISAHDRARTVEAAIDPESEVDDLVRPGHIVPLRAHAGGLLTRAGRTESFVDLPRMAGLLPAAAASGVMTDDGTVATVADLGPWCERHEIKMVSVPAVAAEAVRRLPWLERREERRLSTPHGEANAIFLVEPLGGAEHIALVSDQRHAGPAARVAVFGLCIPGHALGDGECAEAPALDEAMDALASGAVDVLVYVGLPGLCCREAAEADGATSSQPWAIVAKALLELGVEQVEPWRDQSRKWAELGRYGLAVGAA
ncbi:MAG: 3,4-dihydroxy 2-butanone 4-phosphate synthase / cyclohydrolase [Thermoleophilaceae bacterium]|nr:3,4-dihydroxy 2-butanone 4-phosphate synthase / cyclohydrolase [Thermoleophilaceae bacterium]